MFSFISKLFTKPSSSQPESSSIDVTHTEQIQCDIHIFKDIMTTLSTQEQIKIITNSVPSLACILFQYCSIKEQCFIFPLLSEEVKEMIYLLDSTKKDRFKKSEKEYHDRELDFKENQFTNGSGLLFYLNSNNYLQYTCGQKQTYLVSAKEIVDFDLHPYKYQRKLNITHMNNISNGIKESMTLFHPIICTYNDETNSISIIDGMHRYNALKSLSEDYLEKIKVVLEIIYSNNDDEVMKKYKQINTTLPIDHEHLSKELEYVHCIEKVKEEFGSAICSFSKKIKEQEDHLVIDLLLKEELQIRNILDKMTTSEVIHKLKEVNQEMERYCDEKLSQMSRRICNRDNMYLGINWPMSIDLLENKK